MEMPSLAYTFLSFIGVILVMIAVLYGMRWIMNKTNFKMAGRKYTEFHITDRIAIDTKRQLVRLHDKTHDYVILLGDSDLLLDKKLREETLA
ncbi:hypothetical protein [Candidatus Odyssella acanthamoebae]|uniref:Uncharacterized protein n=1 Tax=Candidatus Odyssella acanthamoebae TaxID=91604 RepID=A0A077AZN6_9PROT|nr:hypothetical protein [Candidatus Paracaedibacter acanthamoebae]AIK97188.1 hypothetical protein ID47_11285 [Candidatus Paracaedibacter acanthamoebae]